MSQNARNFDLREIPWKKPPSNDSRISIQNWKLHDIKSNDTFTTGVHVAAAWWHQKNEIFTACFPFLKKKIRLLEKMLRIQLKMKANLRFMLLGVYQFSLHSASFVIAVAIKSTRQIPPNANASPSRSNTRKNNTVTKFFPLYSKSRWQIERTTVTRFVPVIEMHLDEEKPARAKTLSRGNCEKRL